MEGLMHSVTTTIRSLYSHIQSFILLSPLKNCSVQETYQPNNETVRTHNRPTDRQWNSQDMHQTNRQTIEQKGNITDQQTDNYGKCHSKKTVKKNRQTDGQTNRQTDRQRSWGFNFSINIQC